MSVLFYTAANREYEFFAPLYIYFVLNSNPDAHVEIGLEDADAFIQGNQRAIEILTAEFGERFTFRTVTFDNILPGAVRFITEPTMADQCEYVYIGDIDILILDADIKDRHLRHMEREDIPFSNVTRANTETRHGEVKLSGLHFAPTELQYPLPDLTGIDYTVTNPMPGADENVLYEIMRKKGQMIPHGLEYRPEHGIHVRMHSHPFGRRPGWSGPRFSFEAIQSGTQRIPWSGVEKESYRQKFLETVEEPAFRKLYFELDIRARNHLMVLENICAGRFDEFEQESYEYVASRYLNRRLIEKKLSSTVVGKIYRRVTRWID